MPPDLVLASTSPHRQRLLDRLHLPYRVLEPRYDEPPIDGTPTDVARAHAIGKAQSVDAPGAVIIGADQVVDFHGRILGKPGTPERAIEQLRMLSGGEHRLVTAVAVVDLRRRVLEQAVDVTRIRLRALTDAELEAYVARDRPYDCAGSYRVEALGITLFESWRGEDPTAIEGLPLIALTRLLRDAGIDPLGGC